MMSLRTEGQSDKEMLSQIRMDYRQFGNEFFLNPNTDKEKLRKKNVGVIYAHGRIYVYPCFPDSILNCGLNLRPNPFFLG